MAKNIVSFYISTDFVEDTFPNLHRPVKAPPLRKRKYKKDVKLERRDARKAKNAWVMAD